MHTMKALAPLLLCLLVTTGCANAFTTTVHMTDGSRIQAFPRCVSGGTLYGEGIEDGVARSDVRKLSSHAGLETTLIGGALLVAGTGLLIWGLTDERNSGELRVAAGGAIGGIGLAGTLAGVLLLASSAGSLGRECSVRSRWYPHDERP